MKTPFRAILPQRTNLIVRIDGRAFHTYTKGFVRPFDPLIGNAMSYAAQKTAKEISGCKFAYGQSDEFSFLATDYDTHETEMWFAGNKAKIESVAASCFTGHFNVFMTRNGVDKVAQFDARSFVIPTRHEVLNYFIWRQQDAIRNSVSMLARHHFSAKQLHGVSTTDAKEKLLKERKVNWHDLPVAFRNGTIIYRKGDANGATNWYIDTDTPEFVKNGTCVTRHIPAE